MSTISATNFKHESASSNNITLDANGRVGIGAVPTRLLSVQGAGAEFSLYDTNGTADNRVLNAFINNGKGTLRMLNDAQTAGTTAIQFDTAGRVMMPNQPMFYAKHNASAGTSSGQYGRWDDEFVNVGNHASHAAHTGSYVHTRWTAPVTGYYLVWVGNIGPNASTVQRTRIVVNGSDRSAELRTSQDAQHGTSASMMAIVSASAGDWISAYSSSDGGQLGFYNGVYSHFGVKLIG